MTHQQAKVIAGFPGIGKSYLQSTSSLRLQNFTILDLDTQPYSHTPSGTPNPSFPQNYISAILPHLCTPNLIILVGVHGVVRNALVQNGLVFTLVYPEKGLKREYMSRWDRRGSSEGFLRKMERSWEEFVGSCEGQLGCRHVVLRRGEFLTERLGEVLR